MDTLAATLTVYAILVGCIGGAEVVIRLAAWQLDRYWHAKAQIRLSLWRRLDRWARPFVTIAFVPAWIMVVCVLPFGGYWWLLVAGIDGGLTYWCRRRVVLETASS